MMKNMNNYMMHNIYKFFKAFFKKS